MLQVNNAWFVTGAPLLTGETEGGGGMEHNHAALTAPLPGTGLGAGTEPQEVAGRVFHHRFQMYFPTVWELQNKNVSNKDTLVYSQLALCVSRPGVN